VTEYLVNSININLNYGTKRVTPEEKKLMIEMRLKRFSYSAIGRELHRHHTTIMWHLRKIPYLKDIKNRKAGEKELYIVNNAILKTRERDLISEMIESLSRESAGEMLVNKNTLKILKPKNGN
jgi:predicted transcriptional regulator